MSQSVEKRTAEPVHDYGPAKLQEFRFRYDGNDYILREAKGQAVIDYRDQIAKQMRVTGRTATNDGAAKYEPALLARCIVQVMPDGNFLAVSADWCRGLGNHILKDLFSRLERMSGLSDDRENLEDRIAMLELQVKGLLESSAPHALNGEGAEGNPLTSRP